MEEVRKEYGPHEYTAHGGIDCKYGCGCWKDEEYNRFSGPLGLDPSGKCHKNPLDGHLLGRGPDFTLDYEYVVRQRIHDLEQRAIDAEKKASDADVAAIQLAKELRDAKQLLANRDMILLDFANAASRLAGILPGPA